MNLLISLCCEATFAFEHRFFQSVLVCRGPHPNCVVTDGWSCCRLVSRCLSDRAQFDVEWVHIKVHCHEQSDFESFPSGGWITLARQRLGGADDGHKGVKEAHYHDSIL